VLGVEFGELGDRVGADTDDLPSCFEEEIMAVAQVTGLGRAPGGEGLRVEVEEQVRSREVGESRRFALVVGEGEFWSPISGFDGHERYSCVANSESGRSGIVIPKQCEPVAGRRLHLFLSRVCLEASHWRPGAGSRRRTDGSVHREVAVAVRVESDSWG